MLLCSTNGLMFVIRPNNSRHTSLMVMTGFGITEAGYGLRVDAGG